MQSALMYGGNYPVSTLAPDQLIFKPTNDPVLLHRSKPMTQTAGPKFVFSYQTDGSDEPSEFNLVVKKGKNANISINFDAKDQFFLRASDRTRPISIFVPGLAGVALREERRTDAIINNGIAQGDSNLYLRNILLRIIKVSQN